MFTFFQTASYFSILDNNEIIKQMQNSFWRISKRCKFCSGIFSLFLVPFAITAIGIQRNRLSHYLDFLCVTIRRQSAHAYSSQRTVYETRVPRTYYVMHYTL